MYILKQKNIKWIYCSVVFLAFFAIFVTKSTANEEFDATNILNVAVASAPVTLDSRYATDASSIRVLRLISAGLVKLDEKFKYQPDIAISYSHENYQKYTFILKDIYFSDGEKLTSTQVKNFYTSIFASGSKSPLSGLFSDVKEIKTPNKNTIEFYLTKPNPWFLTALETPILKINNKNKTTRIETPIGLITDKNIKFIKQTNTGNIWLKHKNNILKLQVIKDPIVRVLKLIRSEIDVVYNDLPEELYNYTKNKGYENIRVPSASYTYIGFNLKTGATANIAVRKALSYAINRPYIIKYLLNDNAKIAESLLLSNNPAFYPAKINSYNPKKAIKILEDAGYTANKNGIRLELNLSVTTNPFVLRVAQVIQQQLKDVGIKLTISSSEWGSFYANIKKSNFESYILSWVGRFQPDIFYSFFHSSMKPPYGANRGRYSNPKMDKLLENIKSAQTTKEINKNAIAVQKLQDEEKIYLPLWRRNHGIVMAKNIKNCKMPVDGGYEGLLQCVKK